MPEHPYGWLSVLPPVVAVALAIATRRVIVSLLAGVFVGVLVTTGGDPLAAVGLTLEVHLWKALADEERLRVFAFTLMMGAMVGVISRSGGMRGLVAVLSPWASNRRRGQLVTWLLGLLVFFDDYANTVLLGHTLRPLCDRLRISREKLAYLVDSTAAPVAGLALVSTWVASEIAFVDQGVKNLGPDAGLDAFTLFLGSIPYRFYVLWALLLVPLVAILRRDFGPMLSAERACQENTAADPTAKAVDDLTAPDKSLPARWYNAVVPVVVTVIAIMWLLYVTGRAALADEGSAASLMKIFGNSDSYYSLLWGSLAGLLTSVVIVRVQRLLTTTQIVAAAGTGARLIIPALSILWLASTLSTLTGENAPAGYEPSIIATNAADPTTETTLEKLTKEFPNYRYRLYTGRYLSGLVGERLPGWSLPTIVFLLAATVSFATGTSWGTMGIVMPLVIPLTYGVLAAGRSVVTPDDPILLCAIGSVLAGSIFGDHCSPISDTTVLSSQASGCDHLAHVWTQFPYALLVGGVTVLVGTLPVGLGMSVWLLLPVGVAVLVVFLLVFGSVVEQS